MNGGKYVEGGEGELAPSAAQVPVGWQRRLDPSGVVYVSPSGSLLSCLEQVKTYLLTDGTCKCGLECPLVLHKVFNFSPGAAVRQRTAEDVKADEDVTKLCNHKRKILAVATLHRSMDSSKTSLGPTCTGGYTSLASSLTPPSRSVTSRTIKGKVPERLSSCAPGGCRSPFQALGSPQQQELLFSFPRTRLGSAEQGQKSPYRSGHSGILSPASYREGSISPRTDPIGSPDPFPRGNPGFLGASSPSPHGKGRVRQSPPGVMPHGAPVQANCSLPCRTNVNIPLSPTTIAAKSPVTRKSPCGFSSGVDLPARAGFHLKPSLSPSCTLAKKQLSSEKDPLGILDPIPSVQESESAVAIDSKPLAFQLKAHSHPNPLTFQPNTLSHPNPSNFQPNAHNPNQSNFQPNAHNHNPSTFQPNTLSQVPMMNLVIPPPAIVPLPSNLPLPTVKPVSHGSHQQRAQHSVPASVSLSPVTSPPHMPSSSLQRMVASPQRSRSSSSSTSSDHGGFVSPTGPQPPSCSIKPPPRSPRSAMGSPRPSLPSSPSNKPEPLHPCRDPGPLHGGGKSSMFPPGPAGNGPQNGQPGLLGTQLNQILTQQNAASFPASNLLSAAAKAQLANRDKLAGSVEGGDSCMNSGVSSSSRSCGGDGQSTLKLTPTPGTSPEAQSGRAALRDKLMAQQRDLLRKRQLPHAGSNGGSSVFSMLRSRMMDLRPLGPNEHLRTEPQAAGPHPNKSMAKLLQSMSCHSTHQNRGPTPAAVTPNQAELQFGDGPRLRQNVAHSSHQPFSVMGNCRNLPLGPPDHQSHQIPHALQREPQSCRYVLGQAKMEDHLLGSTDKGLLNPGDPATLVDLQSQGICQATQGAQDPKAFPKTHFSSSTSSSPTACLFQNFQMSLPESISDSVKPVNKLSGVALHPEPVGMESLTRLQESMSQLPPEGRPSAEPRIGAESVNDVYRVVMDTSSKNVEIGNTGSCSNQSSGVPARSCMTSYPNSISMPTNLQLAVRNLPQAGVSHSHATSNLTHAAGNLLHAPNYHPQAANNLPQAANNFSHAASDLHRAANSILHAANDPPPAANNLPHTPSSLPHAGSNLSHAANNHSHPHSVNNNLYDHLDSSLQPQPRLHPNINQTTEQGKCPTEGGDVQAQECFRSPRQGPLRQQWDIADAKLGPGPNGHVPWQGQEVLNCSAQVQSNMGRSNTRTPTGSLEHKPTRVTNPALWPSDAALHLSDSALQPSDSALRLSDSALPQCNQAVRPTGPALQQCDPALRPTNPAVQPADPALRFSDPTLLPSSPALRPGNPALRPANPAMRPTDRALQSTDPALQPGERAILVEGLNLNNCKPAMLYFKQRLEQSVEHCGHVNGRSPHLGRGYADVLSHSRQEIPMEDQSPGSSTSLEGPLLKDYSHYNGHYNGHGSPSPSDTKSLSSEEDLRHPDSPSSAELLHFRPQAFSMGQLVWGPLKGFPPWPVKLMHEEQLLNQGVQSGVPGEVEPGRLKTLTEDLEALNSAAKRSRNGGKLNNHIEAAIHEAMSELDRMSGSVHQILPRDRPIKAPKAKRRKISR
ncbi:hypothetical protein GJAV_G00212780 [Gymnothorax javanicus]|nr:hypothetical protein GJAV_G00212780 [Gymnothorax javanicus]